MTTDTFQVLSKNSGTWHEKVLVIWTCGKIKIRRVTTSVQHFNTCIGLLDILMAKKEMIV